MMKINKELINNRMKSKKLTTKDMGEMLNITSSGFLMKLNEKRKFSLEEGLTIAKALDINPYDLFKDRF